MGKLLVTNLIWKFLLILTSLVFICIGFYNLSCYILVILAVILNPQSFFGAWIYSSIGFLLLIYSSDTMKLIIYSYTPNTLKEILYEK